MTPNRLKWQLGVKIGPEMTPGALNIIIDNSKRIQACFCFFSLIIRAIFVAERNKVTDWLRNRNTLEYIGVWEKVDNPHFNYGEFATIRNNSGLNSFKISVKEFVKKTNAISLQAKAGRYGGTYP